MSRLVPSEWEHKQAFTVEAAKAFGAVSGVFGHFGCEPKRVDALDFAAFVETMRVLCHQHRRDPSGIKDLQETISVFDSYHQAVREHRALDDEQFTQGLASAQRLRWWLHQTFPDAGPHPQKN
jgi:hypothetical protein